MWTGVIFNLWPIRSQNNILTIWDLAVKSISRVQVAGNAEKSVKEEEDEKGGGIVMDDITRASVRRLYRIVAPLSQISLQRCVSAGDTALRHTLLSTTGTAESMSIRHANLIQTCSLRLSFSPAWQTSFLHVILISMGFSEHFQLDSADGRRQVESKSPTFSSTASSIWGLTFWRFNRNESSLALHLFFALTPSLPSTITLAS